MPSPQIPSRVATPLRLTTMSLVLLAALKPAASARIDIEPLTDPEALLLSWPSESFLEYTLKGSDDFENWEAIDGFPKSGTGEVMSEEIAGPDSAVFWQLEVSQRPGEQLYFLPLPDDNLRIRSYAELDGPKWPDAYGEGHVTLWHEDKFAAYSITIDDNNSPDFPFWLEIAEAYDWPLTWFVIVHPFTWDIYADTAGSNTPYFGTLEEFAELAELGHDIQLHGSCSEMNSLSADAYEEHILLSMEVLSEATGQPVHTFAYPCGKTVSEDGEHDYRAIIGTHMIGARGTSGGVTPVHRLDYLNTNSLGVNKLADGEPNSLFTRYDDDSRSLPYSSYRGWGVSLYHGLNDERKADAIETFDYVKDNEDLFWVGTFTDVAKYAQERESSELHLTEVTPDRIEFFLTDRMDDTIFDHPLTVKIRLDDEWTAATAEQAGTDIPVRIVVHEAVPYALVEAIPDKGRIRLLRSAE